MNLHQDESLGGNFHIHNLNQEDDHPLIGFNENNSIVLLVSPKELSRNSFDFGLTPPTANHLPHRCNNNEVDEGGEMMKYSGFSCTEKDVLFRGKKGPEISFSSDSDGDDDLDDNDESSDDDL